MRKIAVMIGSDSDLPQCVTGLKYLAEAKEKGLVKVVEVITNSIHRNNKLVQRNLSSLAQQNIDVLIIGAGMANHLTGTCDAFLRYELENDRIIVVGVAFAGKNEIETRIACDSIKYVPNTQAVFNDFVGAQGFFRACEFAVKRELPKIELKRPKPAIIRTLEDALEEASKRLKEKEGWIMPQIAKGEKITEGKTKIIWDVPGTNEVLIESKPDITAGDGAKQDIIKDKDIFSTITTCNCFQLLNNNKIPTHFIGHMDGRTFRARKVQMIPIELVARRIAYGSYLKRYSNISEGEIFEELIIEFFFKDDARNDPLMNYNEGDDYWYLYDAKSPFPSDPINRLSTTWIVDGKIISGKVAGELKKITEQVFSILEKVWLQQNVVLVDLKIECGFDIETGKLLVADTISNDEWRIWPEGDKAQMKDKQVYRDAKEMNLETRKKLQENYVWVAEATNKF